MKSSDLRWGEVEVVGTSAHDFVFLRSSLTRRRKNSRARFILFLDMRIDINVLSALTTFTQSYTVRFFLDAQSCQLLQTMPS
jgi:hypothetical protein